VKFTLDAIRPSLDGAIPGAVATCAPDGTPNISYISQVEYVDGEHVALSYQFFNKTRQNVLANPRAQVGVVHPLTGATYLLDLEYLRTEESGPLFERMKAKLAGIASHEGMAGVFRLRGADVYHVRAIDEMPGDYLPMPAPRRNLLAAARACSERISTCVQLEELLDSALANLETLFGIEHAMVLLFDEPGKRLYTVASRGYEASGVGSEIALGDGVIGVAARERAPIRIGFMAPEYGYHRALREAMAGTDLASKLETEIPFAGLKEPHSQLAVPIRALQRLVGVLYVESSQDLHFSYDDEDALVAVAGQLGMTIHALQAASEAGDEPVARTRPPRAASGTPLVVRHFGENDSVFLDDGYLIKGVAGAILWTLVRDYVHVNRCEFTNRELRLDQRIRLPDVSDNLEARLILLERRLTERAAPLRIVKTGRGRFRLTAERPLQLVDVPAPKR